MVELRNFADVLQRDAAAVKAALTLPWSNGPVEGHINRLKLIKRSGYGRMQLWPCSGSGSSMTPHNAQHGTCGRTTFMWPGPLLRFHVGSSRYCSVTLSIECWLGAPGHGRVVHQMLSVLPESRAVVASAANACTASGEA